MDSPKAGVILADPPWSFRNHRESVNGAAVAHYDTMSDEAIADLPVSSFAADDCVLACWSTPPKTKAAMRCLDAWGFEFVTKIVWIKTVPSSGTIRRGIGFWAMAVHEDLLIARRGDPVRTNGREDTPIGLLVGDDRVFYAPIGEHSEKPVAIHEWLQQSRGGPYLELFARRFVAGWTCWGRELGVELTPDGARPCEIPVVETPQRSLFT